MSSVCVYLEALLSSCLKYLNKTMSLKIYKKYNWHSAGPELAICTARVEGCRAELRALLHPLHHYALRVKIRLADVKLFSGYTVISTWSSSVTIHIQVPNTEQYTFYVCTYFPH